MGQVLQADKLGILSESGGTITLAPSVLTIGGQQYSTSSLNIVLPSLNAIERYQVFAVLNSGVVELVISQNENSTGPASYDAWKLVGSFYSDGAGSPAFGAFVTIKGVPETEFLFAGETLFSISTDANPTITKGDVLLDQCFVKRVGDSVHFRGTFAQNTQSGSGSGGGDWTIEAPDGDFDTVDTSKIPSLVGGFNFRVHGSGHIGNGGNARETNMGYRGSDQWAWTFADGTNFSANATNGAANNNIPLNTSGPVSMGFDIIYAAVGLTNTPIEDL